jgi:uncharacterized protein (TIGR02646 family)
MRHVHRGRLGTSTRLQLRARQSLCIDPSNSRAIWRSFRPSVAARPLIDELRRMAGQRERCFYCSDSLGADVEHFVPITVDPHLTFSWNNLLWICTNCNRKKGDRSPFEDGMRVLVDPTRDDPWRHVTLASPTGILAPRFLTPTEVDRRGERTLDVLDTLNREPLAEGRARAMRRLKEAVESVVGSKGLDMDSNAKLSTAIREDDYGISRWFAQWEGSQESPFYELQNLTRYWRRFVRLAVRTEAE